MHLHLGSWITLKQKVSHVNPYQTIDSTTLERMSMDLKKHRKDGLQFRVLNPSYVLFLILYPDLSSIHQALQLISVISMLASDPPGTDSPANVDAAKQVRENLTGSCLW